jgi:RHS repeat-associated protein
MQPKGLGAYTVPGNRLEVFEDLRYEYDVHGNVSRRKKGAHEEAEFTWNTEHQLKEVKVTRKGTEQTTRYEYDALGRRTRKIDTFGATEYLWDGDLMIESRRNNKQALFLFEPQSFIPIATVQDNKTYWYQCDQVGALQELMDREGNIVWAADYRVWGEVSLRKTGTDGSARYSRRRQAEPPPVLEQPFRFQGQQFDEETELHYNRHRYYDPGVGRFVSQDPIGLRGGVNLFQYAPNPITWRDPLGLYRKRLKPNQANCPCDCNKWKLDRVDRECKGHVPGVGYATYIRDPKDGLWYSIDQTGHGGSAFKMFSEKGGKLVHEADLNEYGDIMPKHKSDVGKEVDLKK